MRLHRTLFIATLAATFGRSLGATALASTYVTNTNVGIEVGRFRYAGHWEHVKSSDGRLFGSSSRTSALGASVTLSFVGSVVRVYGVRGPGGGHGIVTIDGIRYPDIDFYSATKLARAVVFFSPLLPFGTHTIAIAAAADPRAPGHRSSFINVSGVRYE